MSDSTARATSFTDSLRDLRRDRLALVHDRIEPQCRARSGVARSAESRELRRSTATTFVQRRRACGGDPSTSSAQAGRDGARSSAASVALPPARRRETSSSCVRSAAFGRALRTRGFRESAVLEPSVDSRGATRSRRSEASATCRRRPSVTSSSNRVSRPRWRRRLSPPVSASRSALPAAVQARRDADPLIARRRPRRAQASRAPRRTTRSSGVDGRAPGARCCARIVPRARRQACVALSWSPSFSARVGDRSPNVRLELVEPLRRALASAGRCASSRSPCSSRPARSVEPLTERGEVTVPSGEPGRGRRDGLGERVDALGQVVDLPAEPRRRCSSALPRRVLGRERRHRLSQLLDLRRTGELLVSRSCSSAWTRAASALELASQRRDLAVPPRELRGRRRDRGREGAEAVGEDVDSVRQIGSRAWDRASRPLRARAEAPWPSSRRPLRPRWHARGRRSRRPRPRAPRRALRVRAPDLRRRRRWRSGAGTTATSASDRERRGQASPRRSERGDHETGAHAHHAYRSAGESARSLVPGSRE